MLRDSSGCALRMTKTTQSYSWADLQENELLKVRLCELKLDIAGTYLEDCIHQLYSELDQKNVHFHPRCYLADEWLCPDGEPVIGIPFYLVHPRLRQLEHKMLGEVEGNTHEPCMQLLRHETGHAINYAYLLHRRKRWRKLFGPFSADYPDRYRFHAYSKNFVHHLDGFYAQYHPDEDFAETFAVWLTPGKNWREQYKKWRALEKLEYVDALMKQIGNRQPLVKRGKKYWAVSSLKSTLENYYKRRKKSSEDELPEFHDPYIKRIFSQQAAGTESRNIEKASDFLRRHRERMIEQVSKWTGQRKYVVRNVIKDIIVRSDELHLGVHHNQSYNESAIYSDLIAYVTALLVNYSYTGGFKKRK